MIVFEKEYDGESLYDLNRDVSEAMDSDFNSTILCVPQDENGFMVGTFTVTITRSV